MSLKSCIQKNIDDNILEFLNIKKKIDWHDNINWSCMSMNPNITWDIIQANITKPWDWYSLSSHPNITWDIIQANLNKNILWDWSQISINPNITWDIFKNNRDFPWYWPNLSRNPNITWEIIESNLDYPWYWPHVSQNPNITWDIIKANPDKPWVIHWISKNHNLFKLNIKSVEKIAREYFAKKKIARYLRECISNPAYKVCRDRLTREFQELI